MTIQIILAPDEEARLRERAAAVGMDIHAFAREALIEKIDRAPFAELLAPIHEATRRSGMTEDDIDAMVEHARDEVWQERQHQKTPQP